MTTVQRMLANGELRRLAHGCVSIAELARCSGINVNTLKNQMRMAGVTLAELQDIRPSARVNLRDTQIGAADTQTGEFDDEEATQPGVPLSVIGEGFHVRGKSTLVRDDGSIAAQWIKTARDSASSEALLDAIRALGNDMPRAPIISAPAYSDDDLLAAYLIGDSHLGMYAWHEETGSNFDLDIAERNMLDATDKLVSLAPAAKHAVIINAGDYTHSDGRSNTTTKGTPVDVDGRWQRVLRTAIHVLRRIVERALEKHEHVTVINEVGNHDTNASVAVSLALSMLFDKNPRVTVDCSPEHFHWYRFGDCLLGTHHGHLVKTQDLLGVMAVDRARDWGETRHRYMYCGHVHHERVKELPGLIVEYLRSPAPSDAWHRGQGYRSGHDLKVDVIHRLRGKVNRHIVGIEHG